MPKGIAHFFALIICAGCATITVDPSADAFQSGDYTLMNSACEAVPGRGMDTCQVTEGTPIASAWTLVVPSGAEITGGTVDVYFRDLHKAYAISGSVVQIPWGELFGVATWSSDQDGEAEALLSVKWRDTTGSEQLSLFRGLAKIIVTKPGYTRMPIDSGNAQWRANCAVQYSTAGRSAIRCQ